MDLPQGSLEVPLQGEPKDVTKVRKLVVPIKLDKPLQPAKRRKIDRAVIDVNSMVLANGTSKPWLTLNGKVTKRFLNENKRI